MAQCQSDRTAECCAACHGFDPTRNVIFVLPTSCCSRPGYLCKYVSLNVYKRIHDAGEIPSEATYTIKKKTNIIIVSYSQYETLKNVRSH